MAHMENINNEPKKDQRDMVDDYLVEQIKRTIKCDFSTDDEGILQFNKNGYQAKVSDILKAIDNCYNRIKNRGNKK